MGRSAGRVAESGKAAGERWLGADAGEQLRELAGRAVVVAERFQRGGELGARSGLIGIERERLALREAGGPPPSRLEQGEAAIVARLGIAGRKIRGASVPARGGFRPSRLVQEAR